MRRSTGQFKRRSPREWAARGALALGVAALGYCAIAKTAAVVFRTNAPARAFALDPDNGRVAAALAEKLSGPQADASSRARADRLARFALLRDPTSVSAVGTLGVNAALRGEEAKAQRLFDYAQKLSRRDLRTQLWTIERAVSRGDIAGALRGYDVALRTSRNAPELLFPVLVSAMKDPAIRKELIRTMAAQPAWTQAFVEFSASTKSDPQALASLYLGLRSVGVPVSEHAAGVAVTSLVSADRFEEAWRYYATTRAGVDRRVSRDPKFTAGLDYPSPFDWTLQNEAGISTSIQRGEGGGIFDFSAPSSVGGLLLRQLQFLPAGNYVLEGKSANIDQSPGSLPYWKLACLDGRELGRVTLPPSAQNQGIFTGRFSVPSGCALQFLSLMARPSDRTMGLEGEIERVRLRPGSGTP